MLRLFAVNVGEGHSNPALTHVCACLEDFAELTLILEGL
jgi:hypothetical protein